MPDDRTRQLGQAHVGGLLARFSLPAIVGMMAQALYSFIDRFFVGQALGDPGITAITVSFPFMLVMLAFGMLIGFGAAALISLRLGEGNRAEAERVLGNAATLLVVFSLAITAMGVGFIDPILGFFGASEEVLPLARDYLQIIVWGGLAQMLGFGLSATIRGEGSPMVSMIVMLVSVAVNAMLAPILIFGLGMGMKGAALATVAAQAAAAVGTFVYYLGGWSHLQLFSRGIRFDSEICLRICALGSAPCLMQLVASGLQGLLNHQLRRYGGDEAIATMGIIYVVAMLCFMPVFGINQGAQPIIGYNYGARRFDRVKKALETAILAAMSITTSGFAALMLFPEPIFQFFRNPKAPPIEYSVHAMRVSMCMLPLVGFQIIAASYFQAIGKPRHSMFLMLSRQLLLLAPATLALPRFFGLDGVWAALPASDFCATAITGVFLFFELRRLKRA